MSNRERLRRRRSPQESAQHSRCDLAQGVLFHLNKNVLTVWSLSPSKLINTVQLFSDVQLLAFDRDHGKLYASGFESVGFSGGTKYIYRISGADWNNVEAFGLAPIDRVTSSRSRTRESNGW